MSNTTLLNQPIPTQSEKDIDAIEVRHITKTYRGDVRALDGLTFSVKSETVFALLGPNGAGKSTTVKILTTLSKPDSGEACVAGFDVVRQANDVRRSIGCVAQKSGVDLESTGRENLTLQGHVYGLSGSSLKNRVSELLKRFDLTKAADRLSRTYSGGMQRKLDIAMGLVHRPHILFLDEPTTGLDPEARASLWDTVAHLSKDEGLTVLLTTHYLEEADHLADRLAIVDGGKIVVEGSPDELKGELRGDAIHVDLEEPDPDNRVVNAVNEVVGINEVLLDGTSLRARADNGASAVPAVLLALESVKMKAASVTVARPSLDDVYLRYTGRTFSKAHKEGVEA